MGTNSGQRAYRRFLGRLESRERYEPLPRTRGPEKLAGMLGLLKALGHPERTFQVVHVAGTNGKGMTATMIAALLAAAGRRVGLYTSPHLLHIRERIALERRPISEGEFTAVGNAVLDAAERLGEEPYISYFDLLTAMGFLAFQRAGLPWAVLEVGLGGLSDATNTTGKALTVLTRLGLDHLHVLGNDVRRIAEQKLGIVRPGVPTVLAAQPAELLPWLRRRLQELGSPVAEAEAFRLEPHPEDFQRVRVAWPEGPWREVATPGRRVTGPLLACAATALAAGELLLGPAGAAEQEGRARAVPTVPLSGRLEVCEEVLVQGHDGPPFRTVVLDGSHNRDALGALVEHLSRWGIEGFTLIFTMQKDKLVEPTREPLRRLFGGAHAIITLAPQTPRSPSAQELGSFIGDVMEGHGAAPPISVSPDARAALLEAARNPERPLVVAGSFWMLGSLLAHLEPDDRREAGRGGSPRRRRDAAPKGAPS